MAADVLESGREARRWVKRIYGVDSLYEGPVYTALFFYFLRRNA